MLSNRVVVPKHFYQERLHEVRAVTFVLFVSGLLMEFCDAAGPYSPAYASAAEGGLWSSRLEMTFETILCS